MALHELRTEKNKVYLGDLSYDCYTQMPRDPYGFWYGVAGCISMGDVPKHPKECNKRLCELFGSKIPYRFNAVMFKTFVVENYPPETWFTLKQSGYKWKHLSQYKVNKYLDRLHLVDQAVKDETLNILPLMLQANMDTQQLKQRFGKGLWKKLSKTSKSRMVYLAPLVVENPEWAEVRTGILMLTRYHQRASLIAAKLSPTVRAFYDTQHLVYDTMRMTSDLGLKFNSDWSYSRMTEEHDKLVKISIAKRYDPTPFTEVVTFEVSGYTFTLLNSKALIGEEGQKMGHCVGSYAGSASQGKYAVFSVEGNGERATLGLGQGPSEMYYQQCYGRYNKMVSKELREAALEVVRKYNDYIRLRDGRVVDTSYEDTRPLLDTRWEELLF